MIRAAILALGVVALFSVQAQAEDQPGVNVTVFDNRTAWNQYNAAPPIPPTTPTAGTFVTDVVKANFDANPVFGLYEDFVVRYESNLLVECDCSISFMVPADDGVKLYVSDQLIINDWRDKGGGGSISQPVSFQNGISQPFTLWFYENGGGAWLDMMWNYNGIWETVPSSAFRIEAVSAPTSTLPTTTTSPATTQPPVPETTTTLEETTTTWPQTTTIPTTIPTTTAAPVTVPATTTTVLATTTTTTTTTTTVPETTTTVTPVTIPPVVTADQAAEIATSQEALAEATEEEAVEVFAALEVEELSDAQLEQLVVAVQSAPETVRKAFEQEINIFGGQVDTYVPVGSTVPVGQRRTLIVVGVAMSLAPAAIRRK